MSDAPILMPFQDLPFNGDEFVCMEFLNLKERFHIDTAVETGSCLYSTTEWLAKNFDRVATIEINEEFAKNGKHKIQEHYNVLALIGDSVQFLQEDVPIYVGDNNRLIYFLDAHWGAHCPLLEEIEAISKIGKQAPVIVIHDFYTGTEELGYDSYNGQPFTWEWIEPKVKLLEEAFGVPYTHYFNNEAMGAKRGVIYIIPQ